MSPGNIGNRCRDRWCCRIGFVSENAEGGPIEIRLMNEYGGGMPLWDDEGPTDGEELHLSDSLRADLLAFSDRWQASISPEVTDDRWDGDPFMSRVVSARYRLQRALRPGARREAAEEDAQMRKLGRALRERMQEELGTDFRVTYHH